MKGLFKTISAVLAMTLCILAPLSACGKTELREAEFPEMNVSPLPEVGESEVGGEIYEEVLPELPEAPEAPPVPETPEEPKTPSEPETPAVEIPEVKITANYIRVLTNGLNVRAGAGTGYGSLGQVEKGVLLDLRGESDGWYETVFRGQTAYVSANGRYTARSELKLTDEKIEAVIREGFRYMGVPYVYGATRYHDGKGNLLRGFTTSKFDCSSLMQYIFYQGAGVLLDVNTRTQIKQGTFVAAANLQRGDLMFFTNASRYYNTGIERVGHVALYLGDNYILHTASDYAKVEQISNQRWSYFLEARRMI